MKDHEWFLAEVRAGTCKWACLGCDRLLWSGQMPFVQDGRVVTKSTSGQDVASGLFPDCELEAVARLHES